MESLEAYQLRCKHKEFFEILKKNGFDDRCCFKDSARYIFYGNIYSTEPHKPVGVILEDHSYLIIFREDEEPTTPKRKENISLLRKLAGEF
ncbi:MAG: hypothetical protein Q7R52_05165 [archaeon]|nr:hypothetical protein [archaeon]